MLGVRCGGRREEGSEGGREGMVTAGISRNEPSAFKEQI